VSVELGVRVREKVTGAEGVVVGRAEYLYGSSCVLLQPENLKDGAPVKAQWLEEAQVEALPA